LSIIGPALPKPKEMAKIHLILATLSKANFNFTLGYNSYSFHSIRKAKTSKNWKISYFAEAVLVISA